MEPSRQKRQKTRNRLPVILVAFGCILIITAFFVPPMGSIDPTVLTAFGEILTFAGAVLGIDYKYKQENP